jgi:hypothetical protein
MADPLLLSALPAEFQISSKEEPATAERNDHYQAAMASDVDAEHHDIDSLKAHINAAYSVAPIEVNSWNDAVPSQSSFEFGKDVRILFGDGQQAYATRFELHFEVEGDDGDSDWEWRPYLGELLCGQTMEVRFQQSILRPINVDGMHFRRRLEGNFSSAKLAAYEAAVGKLPARTAKRHVWCVLDLPFNERKPLVPLSFASSLELSWKLPTLLSIIRSTQANAAVGAAPNLSAVTFNPTAANFRVSKIWLTAHTKDLNNHHRVNLLRSILSQGVRYHTSEIEAIEDVTVTGTGAPAEANVITADVKLTSRLPSAYLMAVVRYASDLQETSVLSSATSTSVFLSSNNLRPDRFNALPVISWTLSTAGRLMYPRFAYEYASTELHSKMFNSEIYQPINVVSFSRHPLQADDHSLGHRTFTNVDRPVLSLKFFKGVSADGTTLNQAIVGPYMLQSRFSGSSLASTVNSGSVDYVVSVYSVALNFVSQHAARAWRAYK